MEKSIRFVGLDVHAETIAVAVAVARDEVRSLGIIPNRPEAVRRLLGKLGDFGTGPSPTRANLPARSSPPSLVNSSASSGQSASKPKVSTTGRRSARRGRTRPSIHGGAMSRTS